MERTRTRPSADLDLCAPREGLQARHYREDEVAEILHAAARLDRASPRQAPSLSLAEIEQIARDSGIDPARVRQAAHDLEARRGLAARFVGAPLRRTFEVEGEGEIGVADHEQLAADIREAFGQTVAPLQISALGRSLSASAWTRGGLVEVQIAPRDGQTRVRVSVDSSQLVGGLFGGLIGGIGGGVGVNVGWLVPFALAPALDLSASLGLAAGLLAALGVFAGAYGLARALFIRSAGSLQQRMGRLAAVLEERVRGALPERDGGAGSHFDSESVGG